MTVVEQTAGATSTTGTGIGCVLVEKGKEDFALARPEWSGRTLGDAWLVSSFQGELRFENGISINEDGVTMDFFAQVRTPAGCSSPEPEIDHSFLWFWDAFRTRSGWSYTSASGREQELIRFSTSDDEWKVDVRAEELRTYLYASQRSAIIQVDLDLSDQPAPFERIETDYSNEWANFEYVAVGNIETFSGLQAYSGARLLGQYSIPGAKTVKLPRWIPPEDIEYPEFTYGVDVYSGTPLKHTCDPEKLGTYFDRDSSRLHYLTPIYFDPAVLEYYSARPRTYKITPNYLRCLNLWGVELSQNSVGLIEVYLGDIGKKIPPEDWDLWKAHNVIPEGVMQDARFRRDFLNQATETEDIVEQVRQSRLRLNKLSKSILGYELWRVLSDDLERQYTSLTLPLNNDPSSIEKPILILAKVFVDALNVKGMKQSLEGSHPHEQSLSLLNRLLEQMGDTDDVSAIFRKIYAVRSRGGVAHLSNSDSEKVLRELGILGFTPKEAIHNLMVQILQSMKQIEILIENSGR